jgi:hypothetical protein
MFGDVQLHQDEVVRQARRVLSFVEPVIINLKDDFVGWVAHREWEVLDVRASQKAPDGFVENSVLIKIVNAQHRVIGVGLVILGKVLFDAFAKVICLEPPHFVSGRHVCLADRAEQHGGEDSNNGDDAQQFNEGDPARLAMVSFHMGLDRAGGGESRRRVAGAPRSVCPCHPSHYLGGYGTLRRK